jgi:hypothetical protein
VKFGPRKYRDDVLKGFFKIKGIRDGGGEMEKEERRTLATVAANHIWFLLSLQFHMCNIP